jgi:hypothetical protein
MDKENAAFARDLREWSGISKRLYIWDYVINYGNCLMPFPNLYSLKPNINLFVENGVKGVYEEANYFSKGGELAELRTWIMAKTLWDPSYDTDRAIDEFLDGYYEEAADPIRRYIDLVHGKAKMDVVHLRIFDGPKGPLFSRDLLTRSSELFDAAEKAVAEKPAILHRVQLARLPVLYVEIAQALARSKESSTAGGGGTEGLKQTFEKLDAIARKEGIAHVSEGRRYDDWAAAVKAAFGAGAP